ncbi:MAG: hypothetical protein EHM70_06625 [Chloroflexota bacterium]|nr:MAG: hypothetical protein EHM70_06625 [Chloroflexota bacterium]
MTRDLRRYARQTSTRLFVGFLLILFLLGDGMILVIYGKEAALMGLICLLLGLAPLALTFGALWLMELVVKRANRE